MKRQTSTLAVKPAFTHMEDFTVLQVAFRWRKPHRVRKGRCLRVCAEDNAVWKGHVWRSSQHNCTWSIKMANIMLYSTCCQKKNKKPRKQRSDWPFNNNAVWVLGNGRSFSEDVSSNTCSLPLISLRQNPAQTMQSRDRFYLCSSGKRTTGFLLQICNDNLKCSDENQKPKWSRKITPYSKLILELKGGEKRSGWESKK